MRKKIRLLSVAIAALVLPWQLVPSAAAAEGDPKAGAKTFAVCAACHSLRPDVNMTGPSLAGIWDRKAGSLASFPRYSAALVGSGIVWNEQTLDAWLADPAGFVPHNLMTIRGIDDAGERADLIALLRLAGPGGPTGAAATAPQASDSDLKAEPLARQVRAILFCGDTYRVTTEDGSTRAFWERNLRFETDQSGRGPRPGAPVIMPAGMLGDRAAVIFSRPEEIDGTIKRTC
jgi:cytochrome c